MFASAVCLAAIGAPLLMQGAAALAASFAHAADASGGSIAAGIVIFVLSTVPMGLAWLAWQRTKEFQRSLDQEP